MVKIKIPATSANMGPGFDCMGVALNIYNTFYIEEINEGLEIYSCNNEFMNKNNLVYTSMLYCFDKLNYKPKGIKIEFDSLIPVSRGLGSSASCILGGVIAANEIAGKPLNRKEILGIATSIEGHPDNIAPALLGGMVISVKDRDEVYYEKINLSKNLKFCALIPEFTLSTKEARAILPQKLDFNDCIFNIGRTSLMITSLLNGNMDNLKIACQDRLHQSCRGKYIKNYEDIIEKCNEFNCSGVFLSGSGPSIMVILKETDNEFISNMNIFLNELQTKWDIKELATDYDGAIIEQINQWLII